VSAEAANDLARVAARLRTEINDSARRSRQQAAEDMRRLTRAVEQRAKETGQRIDATDQRLSELAAEQDEFRSQVSRGMREFGLRAARIEGECQLLEGLLRREKGDVPVDLDAVPAAFRALVEDVREAERIRSALLDDDARTAHHRQIKVFEDRGRELAETRQRALEASHALAVGKAGSWAFRKAAARYRAARAGLDEQETALAAARTTRDAAERELRRDATQQQAFRAHPGASVADRLAAHVRDRIDAAVVEYELFPAWFVTELGHRPPVARAAEWRAAAIQLVLYRITYEVTDVVVALGPKPDGGHRALQHRAVQAALRRLDEPEAASSPV
jgi:hypothetical protein